MRLAIKIVLQGFGQVRYGGFSVVVRSSATSVPPEGTSLQVLARGVGPVLLHLVVVVVGVRVVVGVVLPSISVLFTVPVNYFNEVGFEDCKGISTWRNGKIRRIF